MYLNWLYQKPAEILLQKFHRYFRADTGRRKKQILSLLILITISFSYLLFIWVFRHHIFVFDSTIGVKIILTFYFHTFCYLCLNRIMFLYTSWVSLQPFDIYYDVVNFVLLVKSTFIERIINPTVRFA